MNGALRACLLPAALAGPVLTPGHASAQAAGAPPVCGERAEIIRQLGEKYGETRRSMGLAQGQGVVEVYASDETGSWTILVTSPSGTACLIAAGEAFQPEPPRAPGWPA